MIEIKIEGLEDRLNDAPVWLTPLLDRDETDLGPSEGDDETEESFRLGYI